MEIRRNYTYCSCESCQFREVIFKNLDKADFKMICLTKYEIDFKKGNTIVKEGDKIEMFLYLKSGLVKLYKNVSNGISIIRIAKPFDFVSLLSVFSEDYYNFSIEAIQDSTVCFIDLEAIKSLIRKNGEFGILLMKRMSENSDKTIQNNIEINKRNLRGRIAYMLLYFSKEIFKSLVFPVLTFGTP